MVFSGTRGIPGIGGSTSSGCWIPRLDLAVESFAFPSEGGWTDLAFKMWANPHFAPRLQTPFSLYSLHSHACRSWQSAPLSHHPSVENATQTGALSATLTCGYRHASSSLQKPFFWKCAQEGVLCGDGLWETGHVSAVRGHLLRKKREQMAIRCGS